MEHKQISFFLKKNQWPIVLLIGVLLIVISMPVKTKTNVQQTLYEDKEDGQSTEIEKRLENLLEGMQSVGKVKAMITYQEDEKIEGIVILAEGADNAVVVRNVTEVVQALFDVDAHKIKVIASNFKQ